MQLPCRIVDSLIIIVLVLCSCRRRFHSHLPFDNPCFHSDLRRHVRTTQLLVFFGYLLQFLPVPVVQCVPMPVVQLAEDLDAFTDRRELPALFHVGCRHGPIPPSHRTARRRSIHRRISLISFFI